MTLDECLNRHLAICDELYRLSLEENRHLQREGRPPGDEARQRRQELSRRLDASLADLGSLTPAAGEHGGETLERARARSLQFLHLERENEQLLLRCSMGQPTRRGPAPASPHAARQAYAVG